MSADKQQILQWHTSGRAHKLNFTCGPVIMGILNVTPDSFSDGGLYFDRDQAVSHALEMIQQGARIIDVGPESTRPGAESVSVSEQIDRAVPVIEKIASCTDAVVSIDTRLPEVAEAAVQAGAGFINDISACSDPEMIDFTAESGIPVCLMHMQGTPATMQKKPVYKDVVREVLEFLLGRAQKLEDKGIPPEYIFIDPGIGFGKTYDHNLLLLKHIGRFVETGYPVLLGTSRKSFLGKITDRDQPADRDIATAATTAMAVMHGVRVIRVHNPTVTRDIIRVIQAIKQAR